MFLAHLPAGYLIGRAVMKENRGGWILAAAMAGAVFPDLDLLYLYFLDATPQHHHTYWTHLPIAWLGIGLIAAIASRHRSRVFRLGLLAFMLGWFSHLLLDTLVGHIWWLYPLSNQSLSLAEVENRFQPWWMNFFLHWTTLLEVLIISIAAWMEIRRPLIFTRLRLAKPVAVTAIALGGLALMEAYRPAPVLAQPVLGASAKDWNQKSFWHPRWGNSGVHKGIDIFAGRGTPVMASEHGLVMFRGNFKQGGKVIPCYRRAAGCITTPTSSPPCPAPARGWCRASPSASSATLETPKANPRTCTTPFSALFQDSSHSAT